MSVVYVKVIDFKRGVKYAKQMGGEYDPTTKIWAVPSTAPELGNLKAYGLARVEPVIPTEIDVIDGLQRAMDDEHSDL